MSVRRILGAAFSFVGAVVGAGMASGAELAVYFLALGRWAVPAALFAAALMTGFFYLLLCFLVRHRIRSLHDLCRFLFPCWGAALEQAIRLGGIAVEAAMLSAAGELLFIFFGCPPVFGAAVMLLLCAAVTASGGAGIAGIGAAVMPLAVLFFGYCLLAFPWGGAVAQTMSLPAGIFGAAVYAAYNLGMATAVLTAVSDGLSRREIKWAALLSGGGILAVMLGGLRLLTLQRGTISELPVLDVLQTQAKPAVPVYAAVLLVSVFTTAATALYSVAGGRRIGRIAAAGAASLVLSLLKLSQIVRFVYPLLGGAAVLITVGILRTKAREGKKNFGNPEGSEPP